MAKITDRTNAVVRQWPLVIAESLGLRPSDPVLRPQAPFPDPDVWQRSAFASCWLGHATVMLRLGGLNIITDPHFEERAGPPMGRLRIGRRRATALPATIDDLPPIDLILLSHAHFDHWDRSTLERLAAHSGTRAHVVIPRRTRRLLPKGFKSVVEMSWDTRADVPGARLEAIRPAHWGARWLWDRHRGFNAYVIEAAGRRVLFGGDTADTDAFDRLGRTGGVDIAILGIGNSDVWDTSHASPEQAAEMARRMGARRFMPIHHSTFCDPCERNDEALQRAVRAWGHERLLCPGVGSSWFDDAA